MGGRLESVRERLELRFRARQAADRERDQPVGEPGILRQEGPVQVGADQVEAPDSLESVAPVVTVTVQDPAERLRTRAEVRAPAVVLEPGQHPASLSEIHLDRDVADQPRAGFAYGLEVGDPEAGDRLLAELIAVPEQLIAATDGQERCAVVDGGGDRLALGLEHVLGDQHLVAILAAPDVDQVMFARVEPLARAGGGVLEGNAPPLGAPLEEEDVAAVRIDVHLLGVEREQSKGRLAHAGTSSCTTVESASSGP